MDTKTMRCPVLYNAFNACYGALFAGIALLSVLRHNNPQFATKPLPMLAIALIAGGILWFLGMLWQRLRLPDTVVHGLFQWVPVLFFVLLACFSLQTMVLSITSWDYGNVFTNAEQYVLYGSTEAMGYFTFCGNNLPLFWTYCGMFRFLHWFGVTDFMPFLVVVNSGCVAGSLAMAARIARSWMGEKTAVFWMLLVLGSPSFWLYGAIAYTDTVSMPLLTGAVLLWLRARDAWKQGDTAKAVRKALAVFLLIGLAAALKISSMILAIALFIDGVILLCRNEKKVLRLIVGLLACVALSAGVYFAGIGAAKAALPIETDDNLPFTHWIMMGLNGNGGYNNPDFQLTVQYHTYEDRLEFTVAEIGRRLDAMGPAGLVDHLLNKLSYLYSDGTEWAPNTLARAPRNPLNRIYDLVLQERPYSGLLFYYADSWRLMILCLCALGAWQDLRRKEASRTVCRIAVFGLTLFLLVWEACSRYILNYELLLLLSCYVPSKINKSQTAAEAEQEAAVC